MPRKPTATSRAHWPPEGAHVRLLVFLDKVREDNGRKSIAAIGKNAHISPSRVHEILTAARGARPAGKDQVMSLVRGLGGGPDDVVAAGKLYDDLDAESRSRQLPKGTPAVTYSPGRNPVFIPRESLASQYWSAKESGAAVVVLAGPPGVGKSALAMFLATRGAPEPSWYQLVRCGSEWELERSLREVLRGNAPPPLVSLPQLEEAFHDYLQGRKAPLQTIVLDNVPDDATLLRLVPEGMAGDYIVTSRRRLAAVDAAAQIDVGPMTDEESRTLTGMLAGGGFEGQAESLTAVTGNNPLAIEAVCGVLRQASGTDSGKLAAEMAADVAVLLDRPLDNGKPGLAAAYRSMCRALAEEDPLALWILGLIAFSDSGPLESAILVTATQNSGPRPVPGLQVARTVVRQCFEKLMSIYLVHRASGRKTAIEMHDLTRLLTREILSAEKPGLIADLHDAVLEIISRNLVAERPRREVLKLFSELLHFGRHLLPGVIRDAGQPKIKSPLDGFRQHLQVTAELLSAIGVDPAEYFLFCKPGGPDSYQLGLGMLNMSAEASTSR
jgi:hypothetical protein